MGKKNGRRLGKKAEKKLCSLNQLNIYTYKNIKYIKTMGRTRKRTQEKVDEATVPVKKGKTEESSEKKENAPEDVVEEKENEVEDVAKISAANHGNPTKVTVEHCKS